MIDENIVRKVREAANVVDVLGDFMELHRDGISWQALCPFHKDRHLGSFKVSERKNCYTCFSCGAHGDSITYLMKGQGYSFDDAVRYLGKKYGIHVEGADRFKVKPSRPRPPMEPLPTLTLPMWMVEKRRNTDNNLCNWLRSLPWDASQRGRIEQVLKNYGIGTSKEGHVIYWQIDEQSKVRTAKMMLYKADGHRDKESKGNFSWAHSRLARAGWWDTEKYEMRQTLFGMHLLDFCPNATVNIVESEKTALVCAIAYGGMRQNLWMASGGKENLSRQTLAPIIERGRNIILYPDHDGIDEWKHRMDAINYKNCDININMVRKYWKEEDGPKADLADILCRILMESNPKAALLTKLVERNHYLGELIKKLDLEIVNER